MTEITSLQNPRIKEIVKLKNRRHRDQTNLFLIEGFRELSRAIEKDISIDSLHFCEELFLGENENALIEKAKQKRASIFSVTKPVFEKISYRDRPDGLLAVAKQFHKTLTSLKNPQFMLIAESIEKPGNLGSILRSSDASGIDALIVCDRKTDIFNPNVVRASVGTLFSVPVIEATSEETLQFLKENEIQVIAATPHAETIYTKAPLKFPIAIAVGTEQLGLSQTWMQKADLHVKIPMQGIADSLNVAAAATLLLFEVVRRK